MAVDRNGLEILDSAECLRLLRTAKLGRVGVSTGDVPTVLPVNFLLDKDRILVRSGRGTKLDAAAREALVSFEVDDFDPMTHSGWSVVVMGKASEVTDAEELAALRHAPIPRWAPGGETTIIAISTELISGRRIMPGHPKHKGESDEARRLPNRD
ncbi:MAG: pyridoxamine 5'-phosphate oxidase family protein [Acidimicrobiales bacterium]